MILMYPTPIVTGAVSFNTLAASNSAKVGYLVQCPRSGSVTQVHLLLGAVNATQPLRVSLQTLDASRNPSGTFYGGSTAGVITTPAAAMTNTATLGTPATAVQGDEFAIVVEWNGAAGNLQILSSNRLGVPGNAGYLPHGYAMATTTWAKAAVLGCFFLGYGDGAFPDIHTIAARNAAALTFQQNVSGQPDEVGVKVQMPAKCRVEGFWVYNVNVVDSPPNVFDTVKLYGSDLSTVLAERALVPGVLGGVSALRVAMLTAPLTLEQGVTYHLTLKSNNSGAGAFASLFFASFDNTNGLASMHGGGALVHGVRRQNSGAWTNETTTRYFMGFLVKDFLPSSGGGASYSF